MTLLGLRKTIWRQLDPAARPGKLSLTNKAVILFILAAVVSAVIETEPSVAAGNEYVFSGLETIFVAFFSVEYLLRLWVADLSPDFAGSRHPRLNFIRSPAAIVDLMSILPALFALAGGATLALRFVRFFRILRLARLGRFSEAWGDLAAAVHSRREELFLAFSLATMTLLVASTLLYWAEGDAQPDKFGSIPRSLWWGVTTLTTVGYGDAYPITPLGKFFSSIVSIAAIGLIALPTGIMAAAMSDVIQSRKKRPRS